MIVGSVIVSIIAVTVLLAAVLLNNGHSNDARNTTSTASTSATQAVGYRGPDTSKKIKQSECTEPQESYNDPTKIQLPDFRFKYIQSVKECLQAAGWQLKIKNVEENTYGEGAVIDQFPSADTDVDPTKMPEIELSVSTGNPPS